MHHVQLKNQHNQTFYDKLTFIYLTLPNFTKTEEQLESLQDKWFFLFRHLHELEEIPPRLREKVFLSLFEKASIARFQPEERQAYESSLKYYRDLKNMIDTAWGEGREEGLEQGREEGREEEKHLMVANMLKAGIPDEQIINIAQVSQEVLNSLKGES